MTSVAPAAAPTLEGVWKNQLGSRLRLTVGEDGSLAGTYESAVGGTRLPQPVVGKWEDGVPGGEVVVGFVVRWPAAGSLAAWVGTFDHRVDHIRASWLLVEGRPATDTWGATRTGEDEFRRQAVGGGRRPAA